MAAAGMGSVLQGAFVFALVAILFGIALNRGMPEHEVRALAFFSLVLAIIALIIINRSFGASLIAAFRQSNPTLMWIVLVIAVILSSAVRDLFRFGSLHADDLAVTFAAGTVVLLVLELLKGVWPITGMGLRRGTGRLRSKVVAGVDDGAATGTGELRSSGGQLRGRGVMQSASLDEVGFVRDFRLRTAFSRQLWSPSAFRI
jgi:hypothetical protein